LDLSTAIGEDQLLTQLGCVHLTDPGRHPAQATAVIEVGVARELLATFDQSSARCTTFP
jgi:hypothetical protein